MHNQALLSRSGLAVCLLTMMTAACGTSAEPPKVAEQIIVRERGAPDAAGPSTGGSQDLVSLGEDVFQTCKGCHSLDADGRSSAGPNLYGVMGRKAGSHEGYSYSDALAASDITWDEASLDGFIADPQGYIPGSEMVVGALRDDERRKAVIAYLAAQGE